MTILEAGYHTWVSVNEGNWNIQAIRGLFGLWKGGYTNNLNTVGHRGRADMISGDLKHCEPLLE